MNALAKYLDQAGLTQTEFAAQVNLTQATVSKIRRGRVGVSLETAIRIEHVTKGAVPVEAWVSDHIETPLGKAPLNGVSK